MKSCFVISPIGQPGSDQREHADAVFEYIVKPAAARAGYKAIRADHEVRPGIITDQMYDRILQDDLIIALLTFHNPNVFYEIAIAEAAARPLILLIERGQQIPFDIKDRRIFDYDLKPKSLKTDIYVEQLSRSIQELETSPHVPVVPFRASLKPLGSRESSWQIFPRADDTRAQSERASIVPDARSFVWLQGIALFSYAKLMSFEASLLSAFERSVEVRVLLMHPDNPALAHLVRKFSSTYVQAVRDEIRQGAEYWTKISSQGTLSIRFQSEGVMLGNLMQNDQRLVYTPYSLVRATSDTPTIAAPSASPLYSALKEDFEWVWDRASAAS
jgi:hypothetical protein